MTTPTHMRREIEEIPEAVSRLLLSGREAFAAGGEALRERDPVTIVTIARGSSDHAASFVKYAIELSTGIPVASVGSSIASIYGGGLRMERGAAIAISQSGKSPDLVSMTEVAHRGGALSIALTNTAGSPITSVADIAIDLDAGRELSVAATKSFVNSVVAGLGLLAHWRRDEALLDALDRLPHVLAEAVALDWAPLGVALEGRSSLYVLGRGPAAAVAGEAALKFKETCGLHAEAYSAAEVLHGPARIVERGFPVLVLAARDAAEDSVLEIAARLAGQGACPLVTSDRAPAAQRLPFARGDHPLSDALALVVGVYAFVERLSRERGFDPDNPPYLRKVTETI